MTCANDPPLFLLLSLFSSLVFPPFPPPSPPVLSELEGSRPRRRGQSVSPVAARSAPSRTDCSRVRWRQRHRQQQPAERSAAAAAAPCEATRRDTRHRHAATQQRLDAAATPDAAMNGYPSENASISPPAVSPMLHASPILLYPTVPSLSVDVGECHTDLGVHAVTHAMPPSGDAHTASDEEPGAARSSPSTSRRWFDSYVHGLQRWKKPLLFLWVALAAISGVGAPKLFGATSAAGGT